MIEKKWNKERETDGRTDRKKERQRDGGRERRSKNGDYCKKEVNLFPISLLAQINADAPVDSPPRFMTIAFALKSRR